MAVEYFDLSGENPDNNWWIWLAYVTSSDELPRHIFGCAAKTSKASGGTWTDGLSLPSSKRLEIRQFVVSHIDAQTIFDGLEAGRFDPTNLDGRAATADLYPGQDIIADVFGNAAARVRCFIGTAEAEMLFSDALDIPIVLNTLHSHLGCDFRGQYLNHLGGFDLLSLHEDRVLADQFVCTVRNERSEGELPFVLLARRDDLKAELSAHLKATNADNAAILSQLVHLPKGVGEVKVPCQQNIFGIDVSIFDAMGEVLYAVHHSFLRVVETGMHAITSTVHIDDKFSDRAKGHGATALAMASGAARVVTSKSRVTADPAPTADRLGRMRTALSASADRSSRDRWFPRTFENEVGVLNYFDSLIRDADVVEAVIVDPFISADSISRLLRLSRTGLPMTLIMSWSGTHPDTARTLDDFQSGAILTDLKRMLDQARPHMAPALRVMNLTRANGAQAFHDRYLMTKTAEGRVSVFLMSNSLNALAMNWPFCMSELKGQALLEACNYIGRLKIGGDNAVDQAFQTTFTWP